MLLQNSRLVQLYDLSFIFGFLYFQPRSQRNIVQQLVQLQHKQRAEKGGGGSSAAATAVTTEGADGCLVAEEVLSIAASYCSI